MPLDHENVRILLVDENPARMALVSQALSLNGYDQVHTAEPSDDLLALVRRIEPGLILVDVDAPSRDTLEQIALVHRHMPRPVVLFTMDRDRAMIAQAIRAGVSAYVVDGLNVARVKPIIEVAIARFEEFESMRRELHRTRADLEDRKLLDRAKGIVMQRLGCSEEDAHKTLRRAAMDRKVRIAEVARRIVETAGVPTPHAPTGVTKLEEAP